MEVNKPINKSNIPVIYDIDTLSSGSLSGITGLTKYQDVDRFRVILANWVYVQTARYESWQDAFLAYMAFLNIKIHRGRVEKDALVRALPALFDV